MSENVFTLNGNEVDFQPDETILEAARRHDIDIPTLCHLAGATPTGACRICVVEIEGAETLMTACTTPVVKGMRVLTESPRVVETRRTLLELMLAYGNHNCAAGQAGGENWTAYQLKAQEIDGDALCPAWGDCKLQELAFRYQARADRFVLTPDSPPPELANPMIVRDFSRCIRCGRCIQACNEIQVNRAINYGYRGSDLKVVTPGDFPLANSNCVFCGQCVEACPTGALVDSKARYRWRPWKTEKIRTTCPYCGVGCQQWLHVQDGRIVRVTAVEDAQPNQGRLCVKGRYGYDFIYSEGRLKTPLIREGEGFREVSWDEALDLVAERFKEIIAASGPDALAGVSCARSINEDSYQMQKLFRAVFRTNNIDHCART
jgi:formate dehydrogenase major subunit